MIVSNRLAKTKHEKLFFYIKCFLITNIKPTVDTTLVCSVNKNVIVWYSLQFIIYVNYITAASDGQTECNSECINACNMIIVRLNYSTYVPQYYMLQRNMYECNTLIHIILYINMEKFSVVSPTLWSVPVCTSTIRGTLRSLSWKYPMTLSQFDRQ